MKGIRREENKQGARRMLGRRRGGEGEGRRICAYNTCTYSCLLLLGKRGGGGKYVINDLHSNIWKRKGRGEGSIATLSLSPKAKRPTGRESARAGL